MCGRYSAQATPQEINQSFAFLKWGWEPKARYNVAPTQLVSIAKSDGENLITSANWGLVPRWAKSLESLKMRPINAKLETLVENRMFAPLLKHRRCLIFADGFYEWKHDGKIKQPVYFKLKSGKPFAFAGLWDEWNDELTTCTIITGEPNSIVAPVHNRMPMMLNAKTAEHWIEPDASVEQALNLLGPYPADEMESYVVSTAVNKVSNDQKGLIEELIPQNISNSE